MTLSSAHSPTLEKISDIFFENQTELANTKDEA